MTTPLERAAAATTAIPWSELDDGMKARAKEYAGGILEAALDRDEIASWVHNANLDVTHDFVECPNSKNKEFCYLAADKVIARFLLEGAE
jgi:hypothetical protein